MKRIFAAIIVAAIIPAVPRYADATLGMTPMATATPTPLPAATKFETATPAPVKAGTPIPSPEGKAVFVSGQILDMEKGYVFFTTGDAFKLSPAVHSVWIENGQPAPMPTTRTFAQAIFDANGEIVELQVSKHPLPYNAAYAGVAQKFRIAMSPQVANDDHPPFPPGATKYNNSRLPLTGKIVTVRFVVEVPPNTPLLDPVYLSTDVSGWNPQATRMERVDALHYAVTLPLHTGTIFAYKYTRGSWQSEERSKTGIAEAPRHFFLGSSPFGEPDTAVRNDTVGNWADYNPAGGQQLVPGATPTPFNPNPYGFPTPLPRR